MPRDETSHHLFTLVWESLVDLLGSATAATLVRRAAARAAHRAPTLQAFTVVKEHFEYRCVVPPSWSEEDSRHDLGVLCAELTGVLTELTGSVVTGRLRGIAELASAGLFQKEDEA